MKTLSRLEIILGGILFLIFMIWTFDKCGSVRENSQKPIEEQQDLPPETPSETLTETPTQPTQSTQPTTTTPPPSTTQPVTPPTQAPAGYSFLYISVDSLNMRDKPFLNSNILEKLPNGTRVTFLNKTSSFTKEITLDGQTFDEPWVQVLSPSGQTGWLFGGGVRPYQKQN